mmetsp:Transcript_1344/g.5086  ORF Transcript_1344/g.5086 Transcript_1344/m.5086 type:complete len:223 (-) Transcript_1344:465-1133(-)
MPPSCRPFALMPPPPLNPDFCFSVTFTMASMIGEPSTACSLCENCTLTFSSPLVLVRSVMSSDARAESVAPGLMFLRWRNMYAGLVCPSHGSLVLRSMKRTSTLPILGSCTCSSMMPSAEMPTLTNSCATFLSLYHSCILCTAATMALVLSTLPICGFITLCMTVTGNWDAPRSTTARTTGFATSLNLRDTPSRVSTDSGATASNNPVLKILWTSALMSATV